MCPPNRRPRSGDGSGAEEDHPERNALDDVVECVVVEVVRMYGEVKALHRCRDKRQAQSDNAPSKWWQTTAAICSNESDQQE
jgi:hypothetical protein